MVALWEHQQQAKDRAKQLDYFALFFEQGCGKSRTTIEIIQDVYARRGRLKTLIVCPPIVVDNWADEFRTYSSARPTVITGTAIERVQKIEAAPVDSIMVCNFQTLLMPECFKALKRSGIEVLVLDESHKIKTFNSKTSKKAVELGDLATYRYILSGTPVLNSYFDLYPQIRFLDGGKTLGKTFYEFRFRYFVDKNAGRPKNCYYPLWVAKPGAVEEIKQLTAPFSMRVEKADCLDLPPLVRQKVYVPLQPVQQRIYDDLDKHMVAALGDHMIVSDMAITNLLRMQQLVSGFATDQIGRTFAVDHGRIDALIEQLEAIGPDHKVIVWAVFIQNYHRIRERLKHEKIGFTEITGEVRPGLRQEKLRAFRDDPSTRVLLANQRAAGTGINLTQASYSIYYSRDYSLENDLQSEARNYRAGSEQHEKVTRIDLVTPETIDEVILNALAAKQTLGQAILTHYNHRTVT